MSGDESLPALKIPIPILTPTMAKQCPPRCRRPLGIGMCMALPPERNAANTVVFPLTVVALAIAVMVGDGCCAFVSISLGKAEAGASKKSVGNSVVIILAGSLFLTDVYLLFADQIIAMFGGTVNQETFHYSKVYFFCISLGIPFYMFGQAMNPIIRADGSPKFAMLSTLAGAVINCILDPIFIFACKWGIMGGRWPR